MHKVRDTEILKAFGANLKRIRLEKGKTQEELAEDAGISQVSIARIEAGKLNSSICTVQRIIVALDIDSNVLFAFDSMH